jgi:L-aminopeptidase/D-esterase-like protein
MRIQGIPWAVLVALVVCMTLQGQTKPRARNLGVPFDGTPGPSNAITDVPGVEVGHTTLISGEGPLVVGKGPVRTGVTAIHPRGKRVNDPVFAGWFALNGNGEMTGTTWVEESGFMEGPLMITNTHSVGIVRDAVIAWQVEHDQMYQRFSLPVVAETFDGGLNDVNGFHVKREHALAALEGAAAGPVAEGNVGGGTGMRCYQFKGGIGTASRKLTEDEGGYTVGVLVQANFGRRDQLTVAGAPVGKELPCEEYGPCGNQPPPAREGSIIIAVATDAPLVAHQLKRLARRASLGVARTGSTSGNSSGDIFLAFSTANPGAAGAEKKANLEMLLNSQLDPVFEATVQATEEAIVNALVAAETMVGINGTTAVRLPHNELREVLRKYGRLVE